MTRVDSGTSSETGGVAMLKLVIYREEPHPEPRPLTFLVVKHLLDGSESIAKFLFKLPGTDHIVGRERRKGSTFECQLQFR